MRHGLSPLGFIALIVTAIFFATPASASPSMDGVHAFLRDMKSEKIPLAGRAPLFNHYYHSEKIEPVAIVFLPGMGEAALKYYELGAELRRFPATIYMWDHLGQGQSSHLLPNEMPKVYIDSFETHLAALEGFFSLLRKKHKIIYVIAHSMGGHLALRLAIRHPDYIQKLALSSPMVDLNYDKLPIRRISWIFDYLPGSYYPPLYFLFKGDANKNILTHSEERLRFQRDLMKAFPDIHREAATNGWLSAALRSIDTLKTEDLGKIHAPVLILQADTDYLVNTDAQKALCKKLAHCQIHMIPESYHELLFEKDPARQMAIDFIFRFLDFANEKSAPNVRPAAI